MSRQLELDPVLVRPLRRPERPARRRREPAPVQARPWVVKTAVAIVVVAVTAAFAGRITGVALDPVLATYRTGMEIQHLQEMRTREAAVNAQLREDIAYLRTPAGVEQEARQRGWVKPGEVALSVVVPEGAAAAAEEEARRQAAAARRPKAWSDRIREWVDTCLAVLGGSRKASTR